MQVATCSAVSDDARTKIIVQSHGVAAQKRMLEAVKHEHATVTAELPIVDAFAATVPTAALPQLEEAARHSREDVHIIPDRTVTLDEPPSFEPMKVDLDIATSTIHVQDVWQAGYRGKGIGIAIIDTGIAPHPDVADRLVAFYDVINGRNDPYDDRKHGTCVAGIAAGSGKLSSGKYAGAAPDASLVGIKVMNSEGKGELSDIIKGIQWAVDNRQTYNIRVINMSLGAPPEGPVNQDILAQATSAATRAGILVVAAAGNSGPYPGTIDSPATSPDVIAVGATIDYRTTDLSDDKVAWYSGTGPTRFDGLTKPDVVVPGTNIVCPDPETNKYCYDTGTSMAAPLVAGIAALIFQAQPTLTPAQVKQVLCQGAKKIREYDENVQGKGVVMADRTLLLAQKTVGGQDADLAS